jgi:hypothetical protein
MAGRAVGGSNGKAVEGAAAGALMAASITLVVFAGSPIPGAFGGTPAGPSLLPPFLLNLLFCVPVAALAAETTIRRRPAASYAPPQARAGEPIAPDPTP